MLRQTLTVVGPMMAFVLPASPAAGQSLARYPTRYYVIHTDLPAPTIPEVSLRMTRMAEAYAHLTRGFTGTIDGRLPFYLYRHQADYLAAGGLPNSAGVFMGDRLMAVAGEKVSPATWRIIQHEGFHQFVHAVITGDIPVWANEGMAEYFEEAIFTGDDMILGLVPQRRLETVRSGIKSGEFRSVRDMMLLGRARWNADMTHANYVQAWSMVHFLAQGENGRYAKVFDAFLLDVGRKGLSWEQAWMRHFRAEPEAFEQAWRRYWEQLPDNATSSLFAKATVSILTSFLARAHSQGQVFDDVPSFMAAFSTGQLKTHADDWLPTTLIASADAGVLRRGEWSFARAGRKPPRLVCKLGNTRLIGSFTTAGGRVAKVWVDITSGP